MNELTEYFDMVERARLRMLCQFQDTGDMAGLQAILTEEIQSVEAAIFAIARAVPLDASAGQILDWHGNLAGIPRPNSGLASVLDSAYKILVYGKIAENTSKSRYEDMLGILRALKVNQPRLYPRGKLTFVIDYEITPLTADCNCVKYILDKATGPYELAVNAHGPTPFGFAGDKRAFGFGVGTLGKAS